jgi:plasmid stability protein
MSKMIQMRNVPDTLHRRLKMRATEAGMTLSDFLIREAKLIAARPTVEEMRKRLAALPAVKLDVSVADLVREGREERDGR